MTRERAHGGFFWPCPRWRRRIAMNSASIPLCSSSISCHGQLRYRSCPWQLMLELHKGIEAEFMAILRRQRGHGQKKPPCALSLVMKSPNRERDERAQEDQFHQLSCRPFYL